MYIIEANFEYGDDDQIESCEVKYRDGAGTVVKTYTTQEDITAIQRQVMEQQNAWSSQQTH